MAFVEELVTEGLWDLFRAVRPDRNALALADPDDSAGAGRGQVMGATGQGRRNPQQVAWGIGNYLYVHAGAAVLVGEVGPAGTDAVALGKCSVEQDVLGIALRQGTQQPRRPPGQVTDEGHHVGVGRAEGYAKTGGDLRERVVLAQVDQAEESALVRRELAAAVTLTGDDEHGYPLDQSMRQVECGTIGNQPDSCAAELRRQTPSSTAQEPRTLRKVDRLPDTQCETLVR